MCKRPKLTKVDRFSPVYQQKEPDLKDESTTCFGMGTMGVLNTEPGHSGNCLRTREKGRTRSSPQERRLEGMKLETGICQLA